MAKSRRQREVRLSVWLLAGTLGLHAGCYSATLLSSPEPTPRGQVRKVFAVGYELPLQGQDGSGQPPLPEIALRFGVSKSADLGFKLGLFRLELSSLMRFSQGKRWILSAMPGVGFDWLPETTPLAAVDRGSSSAALDDMSAATHVTTARLPLLLGFRSRRGRFAVMVGPTVHAGYRGCRSGTTSEPSMSDDQPIHTCTASDRGPVVAPGGHLGLQFSFGWARLMPELSLLMVQVAPYARRAIDDQRTKFSQGDVLWRFALAIRIGRVERRTPSSGSDEQTSEAEEDAFDDGSTRSFDEGSSDAVGNGSADD